MRWPALAVAAALAFATGCFIPIPHTVQSAGSGRRLRERDVQCVVPDRTTRAELLEWFGPPQVIARAGERGDALVRPVAPSGGVADPAISGEGTQAERGDAWFEPFVVRRPIRDTHRVYYWYCSTRGGFVGFLLAGISHRSESTYEVWVLVDEETGLAQGAAFRER